VSSYSRNWLRSGAVSRSCGTIDCNHGAAGRCDPPDKTHTGKLTHPAQQHTGVQMVGNRGCTRFDADKLSRVRLTDGPCQARSCWMSASLDATSVACEHSGSGQKSFRKIVSVRRIHPPFQRAVTRGGQGWAPWRSLDLGCAFRLRWPRRGRQAGEGGVGVTRLGLRREEGRQDCPFGRRVGDSADRWRRPPHHSRPAARKGTAGLDGSVCGVPFGRRSP
jgi:hypothetical protein